MTLALAVAARSSRNAVVAKCECHVSQPHRGGLSVIKESSSSYEEHPYKCTKPPRRPYTCDALSITEMASEIKLICQKSMGRSQDVFIFILFFNHYKSDNRCDLCRCTVRSSSARPIYPRNRRGKIRRLASLHVCCARLISRGAVCIATDDHTRIRSSRCPNPVSSRPCTSLAATCGMPRPIAGGGSSSGTAASCICRVVVG